MSLKFNPKISFRAIDCVFTLKNGTALSKKFSDHQTLYMDIFDDGIKYKLQGDSKTFESSDVLIKSIDNNSSLLISDKTMKDRPINIETVGNKGSLVVTGFIEEKNDPMVDVKDIEANGSVKLLSANAQISNIKRGGNLIVKYGSSAKVYKNNGYIYVKGKDGKKSPKVKVDNNYNLISADITNPLPRANLSKVTVKNNYGAINYATHRHNISIKSGTHNIYKIDAVEEKRKEACLDN